MRKLAKLMLVDRALWENKTSRESLVKLYCLLDQALREHCQIILFVDRNHIKPYQVIFVE